MSRPMIRIHNSQTDTIIDREMNDTEFAQYETEQVASVARKAAEDAIKAQEALDKASGEAKLLAVGLTKAEIKAIQKGK